MGNYVKKFMMCIGRFLLGVVKICLGLVALLIVLIVVLVNIPYYNYGINKDEVQLAYPFFFPNEEHLDHSFSTILHTKKGDFEHQSDALIYIEHLRKPLVGALKKIDVRVSDVTFDMFKMDTLSIEKITLIHKTTEGHIIEPKSNNIDELLECIKKSRGSCRYRKIYDDASLPKKMIETINIEFTLNGEKYKISKTYPIERAYHFGFWDILMGV